MADATPAISVIIPAYGVSQFLGEAIASLQAQTFADWEAVVIDDGAPDDVAGALAPFRGDRRIVFLQTSNGGLAMARNRAAAAARAPVISLLDGDDLYEPDYLETMLSALMAEPDIGFVTCDATVFGLPSREGKRFSEFASQALPITLDRVLRREFNVFGSCTIRRSLFDAVGGYDSSLRSAEDLDLWIRMLSAGGRAAYVPRPLVHYRRRLESLSFNRGKLLGDVARVYDNAAIALGERPEAGTARTMAVQVRREAAWDEGDALVRQGRVRDGLKLLRAAQAGDRSIAWRLAMPLMVAFPSIARPLLARRYTHNLQQL